MKIAVNKIVKLTEILNGSGRAFLTRSLFFIFLFFISLFSCITVTTLQPSIPFYAKHFIKHYSAHLTNGKNMERRIKYFPLVNDKVNSVLLRPKWSAWNIKEFYILVEKRHVYSLFLLSINTQKNLEIVQYFFSWFLFSWLLDESQVAGKSLKKHEPFHSLVKLYATFKPK